MIKPPRGREHWLRAVALLRGLLDSEPTPH